MRPYTVIDVPDDAVDPITVSNASSINITVTRQTGSTSFPVATVGGRLVTYGDTPGVAGDGIPANGDADSLLHKSGVSDYDTTWRDLLFADWDVQGTISVRFDENTGDLYIRNDGLAA